MKKIFTVLAMLLLLISCGGNSANKSDKALYVFNWLEYIPADIYTQFEQETGIKVYETVFASNEEMYAKIKAGATGYDLLVPSQDYAEILKNDNMIQKIDKSKISTYKNIAPVALDKLAKFDPNHEYAIPFAMGATAIIVNTKYVKNYPEDFSIFTRSDLKGRMTLLNDMRQVMTSALLTLGYKQNSVNPAELEAASKLINSWKANIAKFDSESFGKSFLSEEYYVVHGYTDNVSRDLTDEQRKTTKFIIPKKGGLSYVDSFVIPKTAKNVDNAIKFIEFIHRPEVYAKLADKIKVPSINVPATKLMKSTPIYQISDLKNTSIIEDIGEALPVQQKYWEKILTD